jgi:penicillin G amidase
MNRWGAPSENQVYADVDGNIGYKPGGLFPRRSQWDGLLPVPGNGRYEWEGFFDMDALRGRVQSVTRVQRHRQRPGAAAGLPHRRAPSRVRVVGAVAPAARVRGARRAEPPQPEQSLALQRDYHSVLAREVMARLPQTTDGAAAPALRLLQGLGPHPERRLGAGAAVRRLDVPPPAAGAGRGTAAGGPRRPAAPRYADHHRHPALPARPDRGAGNPRPRPGTRCSREFGDDPAAWRWGDAHQIRFRHPLAHLADGALAERLRYPPYPRGGSANTTNNTSFDPADFLVASGASFRMVLDVGNWDAARMTNAPGSRATRARRSTATCWKAGRTTTAFRCCTPARRWKPTAS